MEIELVGLVAATAAELIDHRQADRQVIAVEGEGARRRELGRILDEAALRQAEQDDVDIVGGQEPATLGGRRDRLPFAPVHLDENALELGSLVLAAIDAQRQMLAEAVELADLDRGAERAGLQVEAEPFILIMG